MEVNTNGVFISVGGTVKTTDIGSGGRRIPVGQLQVIGATEKSRFNIQYRIAVGVQERIVIFGTADHVQAASLNSGVVGQIGRIKRQNSVIFVVVGPKIHTIIAHANTIVADTLR